MFGRTVSVDGREFFVMCSPRTPLSEVLRRASEMAKQDEQSSENWNGTASDAAHIELY